MADETLGEILSTGSSANGSLIALNGDMGEVKFLLEPEEYSGSVGAQYDEEGAVGQSFAHMAFKHTANERIPITLYYSRLLIHEKYGWDVDKIDEVMNFHKNFFRALHTPPTLETGLVSSEPATSILLVPGIMHLYVRLVGFNWNLHQRDPKGRAMRQTFALQFVESQSRRWDATEIMERGYNRT
jgi:hypothetical protein